MPRPIPQPRTGLSFLHDHPTHRGDTWLEPEDYCYPRGGMTRRARVRFPDGKLRVLRCGIPDTWFSVPVRKSDGDGYITTRDDGPTGAPEFVFCPHTKE